MKFLVVAPLNAVKYGDVFPLFMQESAGAFDVLGMTGRKNRYGLTAKTYGPEDGPGWNDRNRSGVVLQPDGSFVHTYTRVLIRRRKENGMDCLVIAPKSTVTYKDVFPLIRDRRLRLGTRPMGVDMLFELTPKDEAAAQASGGGTAYKRRDGRWFGRAACCWLTNLRHDVRRRLPPLKTMAENLATNKRLRKHLLEKYGHLEYPRYDNYAAIEVPFVDAIPSDYDGVMGVPVTFLDKWDPDWGAHGMEDQLHIPYIGGAPIYSRLLIQPRHELVGARKGLDGVGMGTPYYRLLIRPAGA